MECESCGKAMCESCGGCKCPGNECLCKENFKENDAEESLLEDEDL
jgi:hypothetical protein